MKTALTFLIIVAVTALLLTSTPKQVLSFLVACALLVALVLRRKRHDQATIN